MILLLPILWLSLWAVIAVLTCAFLGLDPAMALRIGAYIFLSGGFGLPIAGWLMLLVGRFSLLQNLLSCHPRRRAHCGGGVKIAATSSEFLTP